MRERAAGIIFKDDKILLIRRIKIDREYYIFPGGGVEEGETIEEALRREIKEELNLSFDKFEFIISLHTVGTIEQMESYFIIKDFYGDVELGGPEKERMNDQNQYYLEWISIEKVKDLKYLYPNAVRDLIPEIWRKHNNE